MIRRFLSFVLTVAFAVGFGYYWWQAYQLRQQVDRLQAEVVHLKRLEARHAVRKHRASTEPSGETEDTAAAEGWLALANEHADKAKAAFDQHDYGIAQSEFTQAVDDVRRGTAEPVQATQTSLNQVRQKIAQLEGEMGDVVNRVKATVGQ